MRVDDLDMHAAARERWRAWLASPEGRAELRKLRWANARDHAVAALGWLLMVGGFMALGWLVMAM